MTEDDDLDLRRKAVASETIVRSLDPIAQSHFLKLLTNLEMAPADLGSLLNARAQLVAWRHLMRSLGSAAAKLDP